jgi:hypothetical protein
MIGKIVTGKSFGGCIRYVVQKDKAEVLGGEGIRLENHVQMTNDFNMQRKLKEGLGKAVAHISLNFSEVDKGKLTNDKMLEVVKEYLQKMNIKDTQVLIVRHHDATHPHCHIIYNRVDNNGKTIPDNNQYKKNVAVCKDMTLKHGLHIASGKSKVNRQALKGTDKERYIIHDLVKSASLNAKSWKQFEAGLAKHGITLQFKYAGTTDKIQGVSFKKAEYTFKGSELDRSMSFAKLNSLFNNNAGLNKIMEAESSAKNQSPSFADQLKEAAQSNSHDSSLLDVLLTAEIHIEPDPEPFWIKKIRKRQDKSQGMTR